MKNVQKNKNLLSFADDDEDEAPLEKKTFKKKIKSTHEALQDPTLSKQQIIPENII